MRALATRLTSKYMNGGSVLVWMGILWLYLWLIPWYQSFVNNPHWGHNYAEAGAFLILGLAYYNKRLISDFLALFAVILVIPASLELLPHFITAISSGLILILAITDMIVERKREEDLWRPNQPQKMFWYKKHIPRFSYIMLAHIALVYFLVRLPLGTYETELVTKVFDGMLFPVMLLLILEDMPALFNPKWARIPGFFWGMLTVIVSLVILANQNETIPLLVLSIIFTIIAVIMLILCRKTVEKKNN